MRPVHAGEGGRGERGVCWRGDLSHAGKVTPSVLRTSPPNTTTIIWDAESAVGLVGFGGELAMRPVHAGEG